MTVSKKSTPKIDWASEVTPLRYELLGASIDSEHSGFDSVCASTARQVCHRLRNMRDAPGVSEESRDLLAQAVFELSRVEEVWVGGGSASECAAGINNALSLLTRLEFGSSS